MTVNSSAIHRFRKRTFSVLDSVVILVCALTLPLTAQAASFPTTADSVPWTITGGFFGASVLAIAPASDGSVYIGGSFTGVNGVGRQSIAHILANGSLDSGWSADVSGFSASVNALYLDESNGVLYVGGDYSSIGGQSRASIAALATSTGAVLPWDSNANGPINAFALDATSSVLYVAGDFSNIGGQARSYVASLNTAVNTSTATAWNSQVDYVPEALALDPATGILYVGGDFGHAGGAVRSRLAAFDTATGLLTSWNPGANNVVKTLSLDSANHTIYAGGFFTAAGGGTHRRVVALDTTTDTFNAIGGDANANNNVWEVLIDPNQDLYIGGQFTTVGGQSRARIASVSSSTGAVSSWNPDADGTVQAFAFSPSRDKLYVGGDFTTIGGVSSPAFAEFSVLVSAGVTITESSGSTTATESGVTDTYTVVLDSLPTGNVDIALSSTSGVTTTPATLTFTTGNWNIPQTVTVTAVDDSIAQGTHTATTTHTASSADVNYNGISVASVVTTVTDNDTAGITVGALSGNTNEQAATGTFTVVLTSQPTADVTIGVTSDDTSEGTVSPSSLTFTALNWNVPQTVTVTGVDDSTVDGNVTYHVVLAAAVSADSNYNGLNPSDVTVVNNDNDSSSSSGGGGGGCGGLCNPFTPSLPPINPVFQTYTAGSGSAELQKNLQAMGISVHTLLKLPDDGRVETQNDSTVYYVGADGMRHAFPHEKVYFSWYHDYSGVQLVSAAQLASIPLGKNVTYKPGVKLVKFLSTPNVYAVSKGAVLHWVKTGEAAQALYGAFWSKQVDDISDAFYADYSFGTEIISAADYDPAAAQASVTSISDNYSTAKLP